MLLDRFLITALLVIAPLTADADVTLSPLFSDHAVLLRAQHVPIWGRASQGERIEVSVDGASALALADAEGRWKATLDLFLARAGPHELIVTGKNRIVVHDVLVGE